LLALEAVVPQLVAAVLALEAVAVAQVEAAQSDSLD
jgi:hypothetical protein